MLKHLQPEARACSQSINRVEIEIDDIMQTQRVYQERLDSAVERLKHLHKLYEYLESL